jgi:hypothetical protein
MKKTLTFTTYLFLLLFVNPSIGQTVNNELKITQITTDFMSILRLKRLGQKSKMLMVCMW